MDGKLSLAPRREFFPPARNEIWKAQPVLSVVDKDLKVDNHPNRCAHFSDRRKKFNYGMFHIAQCRIRSFFLGCAFQYVFFWLLE